MEQDRQDTTGNSASPSRGKRRSRWIVAGGVAVLALAGVSACGGGMKHGGHFAERGIDRALGAVDATAEQEERIREIIDGARAELRPMMREFRDARAEMVELITAPTIDRTAAEALRAERIAAIDEASQKLTAAALDAAEVLTPEQRATLVEQLKERRGPGRW